MASRKKVSQSDPTKRPTINEPVTLETLNSSLLDKAADHRKKSGEIVEVSPNAIGGVIRDACGLRFDDTVTKDEWEQVGDILLRLDTSLQWYLGDWVAYADVIKYGKLAEFAEKYGRQVGTLSNYASVSRSIEISRRRENLTFGHHQAVMTLEPDEQDHFLDLAEQGSKDDATGEHRRWSVKELRQAVRDHLNRKELTDGSVTITYNLSAIFRSANLPNLKGLDRLAKKVNRGDTEAERDLRNQLAEIRAWTEQAEEALNRSTMGE